MRDQLLDIKEVFDKSKEILTKCAEFYEKQEAQGPSSFFQRDSRQLTQAVANPAMANCLGLLVNMGSSTEQKYAKFLYQQGALDVLLRLLSAKLDLVRKEAVVWAIKNMAQYGKAACVLSQSRGALGEVFALLTESNVDNIRDACVSILGNVCKHGDDDARAAVHRKSRQYVMRQLGAELLGRSVFYQAYVNRLVAYLSLSAGLRQGILDAGYVRLAAKQLRHVFREDPVSDLKADLVASSALYALGFMVEQGAADGGEAFADALLGQALEQGVVPLCAAHGLRAGRYVCKPAAQFLRAALSRAQAQTLQQLGAEKAVRRAFARACAAVVGAERYPHEDAQKAVRALAKLAARDDEYGVGAAVREALE